MSCTQALRDISTTVAVDESSKTTAVSFSSTRVECQFHPFSRHDLVQHHLTAAGELLNE